MMARARLPAIEALYTILDQFSEDLCPTCLYPAADTEERRMVIQACRTVLDRAGLGPHATITLTPQADGAVNLELLSPAERESMRHHLREIRALKQLIRERQDKAPVPVGG